MNFITVSPLILNPDSLKPLQVLHILQDKIWSTDLGTHKDFEVPVIVF